MSLQNFVLACWIVFMLYWLLSAVSVKPIQSTRGWLNGGWYTLLFVVGYFLILNFKFIDRLGVPMAALGVILIPPSVPVTVLTVIFLVAGLVIAIAARRALAGNWSSQVAIKEGHELIRSGLYRYVRNPIYSGMLLMVLGTVLSFGNLSAWTGFVVILLGMVLKLKGEERMLTEHFGRDYDAYKQHSKALIPFV